MYGNTFSSAYGKVMTDEWREALAGFDDSYIGKGLREMSRDKRFENWPPNPIQFRFLCLPSAEELGLPSETESFSQAVGNSTEKHPAVIYTLRENNDLAFTIRRSDLKQAERIWSKTWAITVDYVREGGELPEPEKQITEESIQANQETIDKTLEMIRGEFQ